LSRLSGCGFSSKKALLARFAKAAGAGEMLNIQDLKAAYEKAIGHATSNSTVYSVLALAQADAASVSSQTRHRGSERF